MTTETPVRIETRWFKRWVNPEEGHINDYDYVVTFPDGRVEEMLGIPNDWLGIEKRTDKEKRQ